MTDTGTSLRTARERTIDALCRGFADDALSLGELERRLDRAREARTPAELESLLADLAPAPVLAPEERPLQPVRAEAGRPPQAGEDPRTGHLAFAVMAGTVRRGRWKPPSSVAAVAIMGGVELDFRDAILLEGVTEINCFAFWGGVEITVPPHVNVESRGFAIMGGFEQTANLDVDPAPGAPTLRVNGLALMGGVEIKVAESESPGTSARRLKGAK